MMIRHATGRIQSFTEEEGDKSVVCGACHRIVVSLDNLNDDDQCPYCHNNVNVSLNDDLFADSEHVIAEPC